MRLYRDAWLTVTAVVLVCGVAVAVADFTVATVLAAFFAPWVFGVCVLFMLYDGRPRCSWARVLAESTALGLVVLAACGLFALLGAAAWLPLLVPLAVCPWVVRRAVRVCRRRAADDGPVADEPGLGPVMVVAEPSPDVLSALTPADLDLEELCWAWRRSYVRLQRCRTVAETTRVVAERQLCLDELERRSPGGLRAWLKAGARAAGDPSRFVIPAGPTDVRDNAA